MIKARGADHRNSLPASRLASAIQNEVAVPVPSKIEAPRLYNVYARERVFGLLDRAAGRRVIWLSAPAGYGKTMAVASWLHARALRAIWYQCDAGDGDAASFFHFFSLALARALSPPAKPLLQLSPELYGALPTFTRNYFRDCCARLPTPAWIVLDNWQDVPQDAALRDVLPIAINELPRGIGLAVISREEPGANLFRLQNSADMVTLGTAELELTELETAGLAASHAANGGRRTHLSAQQLRASTHGWAAALAALLRLDGGRFEARLATGDGASQAVFDFLTVEVFDRLDGSVQEFLLKTSCLESFSTTVAQELTGNDAAGRILDALVRGNAFTLQRPVSGTYYYHPLFRQLLRGQAIARFSDVEREQLARDAARLLASHGDPEAAIGLLLEAAVWPEAIGLILRQAPLAVQQGRFKTVADWVATLPDAVQAESAWVSYWVGVTQLALAFAQARPTLEHAYTLFVAHDDRLGQMLAASAVLHHHGYSYVDFSPMIPWIGALGTLLDRDPQFPSTSVELQILSGFVNATAQVQPGNPRLNGCVRRMSELAWSDVDPASHSSGVSTLLHFFGMSGRTAEFRALAPRIDDYLRRPEVGPAAHIVVRWIQAYHLFCCGDERAHALLDEILVMARHNKLLAFELRIRLSQLQSTSDLAQFATVAAAFDELEPLMAHAPAMAWAHFQYLKGMYHLSLGDLPRAQQAAAAAATVFLSSTWVVARAMLLLLLAELRCALADYPEARALLSQSTECVVGMEIPLLAFNGGLVAAEIARRSGPQTEFLEMLRTALAVGRQQGYANSFYARARLLPSLIPHALEHGIEIEYCRWLIRKRRLRPPSHEVAGWPWPIRIHTLGRFAVLIDDAPPPEHGKSPHRPLDLLKAILLDENGGDVSRLMERLWPDWDGDAARNAFDLALHRLRKLLAPHREAVLLSHGRVRLDLRLVWVDAFALAAQGETSEVSPNPCDAARRLLQLYQGPFLADEEQPWMFLTRERLRNQFIRRVGEIGNSLRDPVCWGPQVDLYQRALELEPLAEEIHRALIVSLIAQGRAAEALAAYQRCKETLARLLQTAPSPVTQALLLRI